VDDTETHSPGFDAVPGHTYIALKEDFDIIPTICFLANVHERVVCFLDDAGALVHYNNLVSCYKRNLLFL
jgi:hypothetical protein